VIVGAASETPHAIRLGDATGEHDHGEVRVDA
jgi:hypothetical protein